MSLINCSGGGAKVENVRIKIELHVHIVEGGRYEQPFAKVSKLQGINGKHQLLDDQKWSNSVLVSTLRYLLERATSSRALSGDDEAIVEKTMTQE